MTNHLVIGKFMGTTDAHVAKSLVSSPALAPRDIAGVSAISGASSAEQGRSYI